LNATVLKTVKRRKALRGFESLPLRYFKRITRTGVETLVPVGQPDSRELDRLGHRMPTFPVSVPISWCRRS
jgi:hypothetical protein